MHIFFIDKRDGFSSHCPIKSLVICQPLKKFDMFIFFCFTYNVFHIIFPENQWGTRVLNFWWGKQRGGGGLFSKVGQIRIELWYRSKEVQINQVFYSTHKENIRKSGINSSGNLVELLQHRVERGDNNLENQLRKAYDILFQFIDFLFFFYGFRENCDFNQLQLFMCYSMVGKYK